MSETIMAMNLFEVYFKILVFSPHLLSDLSGGEVFMIYTLFQGAVMMFSLFLLENSCVAML